MEFCEIFLRVYMEPSGGIGRLCSGLRGSKKKQWRFGERETRSRDQGKDRMSVERGTEFFFCWEQENERRFSTVYCHLLISARVCHENFGGLDVPWRERGSSKVNAKEIAKGEQRVRSIRE